MLIEAGDADSVLGAAASYYTDPDLADADFADEHSFDRQRYFNMVCWVYGSDPANRQALLLDAWGLPEHRADQCAAEYALLDRSWSRLLRDHVRDGAASIARSTMQDVPVPGRRVPQPSDDGGEWGNTDEHHDIDASDDIADETPVLDLGRPLGRAVPREAETPMPQQNVGRYRPIE